MLLWLGIKELERETGFEELPEGIPSLRSEFGKWVLRHINPIKLKIPHEGIFNFMSGRRDLNPRPFPWQGNVLPLNYSRSMVPWAGHAPATSSFSETRSTT